MLQCIPSWTSLLPDFRLGTSYQGIVRSGHRCSPTKSTLFTLLWLAVSTRCSPACLPSVTPGSTTGLSSGPTSFVNLLPDHVILHTLTPLGPEHSRVVCDWLFTPEETARPGFDPADTVAVFDITNRQDWDVCEWVQAGVRSRAFAAGGVYVGIERHIRGFNDWVLDQLGLSAESPAPDSPTPRA